MMSDNSLAEVKSVLQLKHAVFDELTFSREGFQQEGEQYSLQVKSSVEKDAEGEYRVSLFLSVKKEREYTASVRITGYFSIDEKTPRKEDILQKNAVAILFPYVRSELTLLTAQPETTPLVLPALNINSLIDKSTQTE